MSLTVVEGLNPWILWCPKCEAAPDGHAWPVLCQQHAREAWKALATGDRRSGLERRGLPRVGPWSVRADRRRGRDRRRS